MRLSLRPGRGVGPSVPAPGQLLQAPSDRNGNVYKEMKSKSRRKDFLGPSGRLQACSGNTIRENGFK